jgi:hypothetical protein
MSDLNFNEKMKLEKLFEMGGGYVLDFSNRTLTEFVVESTGRNIYDAKYDHAGGSKANRIRSFWEKEPNHPVGKLITDLFEYCRPAGGDPVRRRLFEECERIATRLLHSSPVDSIDAITPEGNERGFEAVARAVRDSIEKNEPEAGLDRFTYLRHKADPNVVKAARRYYRQGQAAAQHLWGVCEGASRSRAHRIGND